MYGTTLNTSYEQTHANETNSPMKTFLEDWYVQHLSSYDTYIADGIFCNDRSLSTTGSVYNGYLTDKTTDFGAMERLYYKKEPTLQCPLANDKFTVSETLGNGKNSHPIGLITADELSMAGVIHSQHNQLFYLFTGASYWTMSPFNFRSSPFFVDDEFMLSDIGTFKSYNLHAKYGVRPVINLKADTEITGGIGTANDPFGVKEV